MEISRSTQPMAFLMKNSRSVSMGVAYRSNLARSGWPRMIPGSSVSRADRRTQKCSSVAHGSISGQAAGCRSAIVPATVPAREST